MTPEPYDTRDDISAHRPPVQWGLLPDWCGLLWQFNTPERDDRAAIGDGVEQKRYHPACGEERATERRAKQRRDPVGQTEILRGGGWHLFRSDDAWQHGDLREVEE